MSLESMPGLVAAPAPLSAAHGGEGGTVLHALFEASAATQPDAEAVRSGGETLTYAELNARANRLAHHLRGVGVGPEASVGVFLPRGLDAVVAMLGTWKAGGVYVPLDPGLPQARVGTMAEEAGLVAVVTGDDRLMELPLEALAAEVVCLDGDEAKLAACPDTDPEPLAGPENLAYVIFTSGSTGTPKGVAVEHGAAVRDVRAFARACGYTPADRALLFASLSFDVSIEQLMAPLSAGGSVTVRAPAMESAAEFLRSVAANGLTVLNLPPAYWAEVFEADAGGVLARLRLVVVGGDALRGEAVRRWLARAGRGVRLLNAYGPTEAVVTASLLEVGEGEGDVVRLGPPLHGRHARVADGGGDPLPAGTVGELWLGGVLARGYLGRPDLTAGSFVPDPLAAEPGARLYRTGDLVREEADGSFSFHGRIDHQVKVRGLRVELGEIEAALAAHPAVRDAVVVVRAEEGREGRLAAFVTCRGAVPEEEIVASLRETLPDYMVPSAVRVLDAFPLLPSGKVDRPALAALRDEGAGDAGGAGFQGPTEQRLAEIWTELLGTPVGSRDDDFFELGGDSLVATQLVAHLDAEFNVDVPMRDIFDASTLREVAACIDALVEVAPPAGAAEPVRRVSREGDIPLTHAQEQMWLAVQPGGVPGWFYNIAGGLRMRGALDVPALERALSELVRRHEPLRTAIRPRGDSAVQVVLPPSPVRLDPTPVDGEGAAELEHRLGELAEPGSETPFDLAAGPLLRTRLFRLEPDHHVLWLVIHHIVSDGLSLSILFRELGALYSAYTAGRPSPLGELPYQFADFASMERERLDETTLAPSLAFWRSRLSGAPTPATLPGEVAAPAGGRTGATLTRVLAPALAEQVRVLGRAHSATTFMVLLAAWKTLFRHLTGQEDVVVGSHISGRRRPGTELLLGYFVNVLALRTGLDGNPTFTQVLERVREVTLSAYQHQDAPFERVVDEVRPQRAAGDPPFFRTMFAMQNLPVELPSISGMELSLIAPEDRSAKFELILFAMEEEDGIRLDFNYRIERFPAETIRRAGALYEALLAEVVRDPGVRLNALDASLAAAAAGGEEQRARREDELRMLVAEQA